MELPSFQEIPKRNDIPNGGKRGVLDECASCPQWHVLHYLPTGAHAGNHHRLHKTMPHRIWRLRRTTREYNPLQLHAILDQTRDMPWTGRKLPRFLLVHEPPHRTPNQASVI